MNHRSDRAKRTGPRRLLGVYEYDATFPPGFGSDAEDIVFRVEVWQLINDPTRYKVYILALEFYRLQSSFPQENGVPSEDPSDEILCVDRGHYSSLPSDAIIEAASEQDALRIALNSLLPELRVDDGT